MLKELIKAQTEAAKRAEEEKKELFQYLRESDNRTQELVLDAIRELGTILKKWKLDLSFSSCLQGSPFSFYCCCFLPLQLQLQLCSELLNNLRMEFTN